MDHPGDRDSGAHSRPLRLLPVGARAAPEPQASAHPAIRGRRASTERFLDRSRTVRFPGRRPRTAPARDSDPVSGRGSRFRTGSPRRTTRAAAGPFPLVIFGHGFAVTPATVLPLAEGLGERRICRRGTDLPAGERTRTRRT